VSESPVARGGEAGVEQAHGRRLLIAIALGVLAYPAGTLLEFPAGVDPAPALRALSVTVLVAACWLSAALPLGAASLLPLALFPLLAVQPMAAVARSYSDPILWMYFGGFVLARAIERVGLHRRIALHVIAGVGLRPRRLVLGFLLAALLLSMWISNTATALMLMPIGVALVDKMQAGQLVAPRHAHGFGVAVMLAIAYGCSIGGIGTPIGTPTNLVFFAADNYGALQKLGAPELGFGIWLLAFGPLALVLGLATWLLLTRWACRLPARGDDSAADAVRVELAALGRMRPPERRVLALFAVTVLAWVWRGDLGAIPGWVSLVGLPKDYVLDGVIAVLAAVAAFVIPSGDRDGRALMDWKTASAIPWDMYFLLAGGFAIAQTLDATGLSRAFALSLAPLVQSLPPVAALALVVVAVTLLSEVATNVAIASLMMPVLMATARSAELDPRALLLPATIAASFGFALPIATPPNAIVFATGKVTLRDMVRAGLIIDLLCGALLVATCFLWAFPVLGIEFGTVPAWWRK
jgi:sodium-dependent dicarboxylate transporter 2/3/5